VFNHNVAVPDKNGWYFFLPGLFFFKPIISLQYLLQIFSGYMIPAGSILPSRVLSSHLDRVINISARAGQDEPLKRKGGPSS
jgi:hypothetical protein